MMTKFFLIFLFLSVNAFSQPIKQENPLDKPVTIENLPQVKTPNFKDNKNFTIEQINSLNQLLFNQEYAKFYELIYSTEVSKENYSKYLLSKVYDGHIPVYWLLASYFATEKKELETHTWYYIAIILTQQEVALCNDKTAIRASNELNKQFNNIMPLVRSSPQHTLKAMNEVMFFIDNLKEKPHPNWICYYGYNANELLNNLTISKNLWKTKRDSIYKDYKRNITNQINKTKIN